MWGRFMTSKVSRKCPAAFWVSDPGVAGAEPGDAHDLTGREIMLVSALCASGGAGEIHYNPPRHCVQDRGQRQAERLRGVGSSSKVQAPEGTDRGEEEEEEGGGGAGRSHASL